MKFSIITPSFRQLDWLRLNAAAVADQAVEVEHLIQDGGSGAEFDAWAATAPASVVSEPDAGMYDAINRGLRRARGELCAHLNCDEQYLPGALAQVAAYFDAHPEVDIALGDVIVVDRALNYLCSRKVVKPSYYHSHVVSLGSFTAATFFRRSALHKYDLFFDTSWRYIADAVWMLKALRAGARIGMLGFYTSTFMDNGANLALSRACHEEGVRLSRSAPGWAHRLMPLWILHYRLRRLLAGCYHPRPVEYAIYLPGNSGQRTSFRVATPQWRWDSRLALPSPHREFPRGKPSA